jgi:hypothetical protein
LIPSIEQGFRQQENTFDYNKDAGMFVCPAGHMAIRKLLQVKKVNGKSPIDTYFFDVEKCTWIRKSQFVRKSQYANAGCNGHFYCKPEKNSQIIELTNQQLLNHLQLH